MSNLNVNEYGDVLRINMGEDVSAATKLNFIFEPRLGDKKEIIAGVTVGTTDVTEDDETFLANQYLEYTTLDGDLDFEGQWRIKGEATMSATRKVISDYRTISVLA